MPDPQGVATNSHHGPYGVTTALRFSSPIEDAEPFLRGSGIFFPDSVIPFAVPRKLLSRAAAWINVQAPARDPPTRTAQPLLPSLMPRPPSRSKKNKGKGKGKAVSKPGPAPKVEAFNLPASPKSPSGSGRSPRLARGSSWPVDTVDAKPERLSAARALAHQAPSVSWADHEASYEVHKLTEDQYEAPLQESSHLPVPLHIQAMKLHFNRIVSRSETEAIDRNIDVEFEKWLASFTSQPRSDILIDETFPSSDEPVQTVAQQVRPADGRHDHHQPASVVQHEAPESLPLFRDSVEVAAALYVKYGMNPPVSCVDEIARLPTTMAEPEHYIWQGDERVPFVRAASLPTTLPTFSQQAAAGSNNAGDTVSEPAHHNDQGHDDATHASDDACSITTDHGTPAHDGPNPSSLDTSYIAGDADHDAPMFEHDSEPCFMTDEEFCRLITPPLHNKGFINISGSGSSHPSSNDDQALARRTRLMSEPPSIQYESVRELSNEPARPKRRRADTRAPELPHIAGFNGSRSWIDDVSRCDALPHNSSNNTYPIAGPSRAMSEPPSCQSDTEIDLEVELAPPIPKKRRVEVPFTETRHLPPPGPVRRCVNITDLIPVFAFGTVVGAVGTVVGLMQMAPPQ